MAEKKLGEQGEPRTTPSEEEQIDMAARQREDLPRTDPTDDIEFVGDTAGDPELEHGASKSMDADPEEPVPPKKV